MSKSQKILVFSLIFGAFLLTSISPDFGKVWAQDQTPRSNNQPDQEPRTTGQGLETLTNPLQADSIGQLVQDFIDIASYILILGAVLALIWVGFQFVLSRGNPTKMVDLKNWLFYIIIGVAVIIGARVIIQIIINTLASSGVVEESTIRNARDASNGN